MRFFTDLGKGFSTQWRALEFLVKHGLWYYFIFPLLISGVMLIFGMYSLSFLRDWLSETISGWIGLNDQTGWLREMLGFLVNLAAWLITLYLTYLFLGSFSKYMTLIVLSPLLARLSERVEEIMTGRKYPFHFGQFIKDILRGIVIVFRNMFIEYAIVIIVFLFGLIPVIGWIIAILAVPFLFFLTAYFMGFSMMDYTSERRRLRISQSAAFVNKHKGFAIGNGITFTILLMIPVLGLMLAPILCVTAATIGAVEYMDQPAPQKAQTAATNPPPQPPSFDHLYNQYYGQQPPSDPPKS